MMKKSLKLLALLLIALGNTYASDAIHFNNSTDQTLYIQVMRSKGLNSAWWEVDSKTIQARQRDISWDLTNLDSLGNFHALCIRIGGRNGTTVTHSVRDRVPTHKVQGCDGLIMISPIQPSSMNAKYDIMGPLSAGNYYMSKE